VSKNAATEAALSALHGELAAAFKDMLEARDESGKRLVPPAQVLNVIRQFLKDNGIEADRGRSKVLDDLSKDLPFDGEDYSAGPTAH